MSLQSTYNDEWVNHAYRPFTRLLTPTLLSSHLPLGYFPLIGLLLAVIASLFFSCDSYVMLLIGAVLTFSFGVWELSSAEVSVVRQKAWAENWYANLLSKYSESLLLLGLTLHLFDSSSKNLIFIGGLAIIGSLMFSYSSSRFYEIKNHLPTHGAETAIGQSFRWLIISIGAAVNLPILILLIMAIFYNAAVIRRIVLWANK
ncbi:MAG: hypothetical protein K0S29_1022 [Gammaproteobacteria bacterium]|jgi:hypothetical protein|nr:hypothetical protein [Gammaproteobacteria bacterium]